MTKAPHLRREQVAHLVRAAAGISNEATFVLVGTGAVIAQLRHTPYELMATREVDLYAPDAADPAAVSDLIDGSIGEGSPFDETFGYYAHGVGQDTAILPDGWEPRARRVSLPSAPGITLICPDMADIALSKLCAWREKDRAWLDAAWRSGLLDGVVMTERAGRIADARAPDGAELRRRIGVLGQGLLAPEGSPGRGTAAELPDASGGGQR